MMCAPENSRWRGAEHLGLRLPYSKHCQRAFEQTPANPKGISSSSPGLLQPWVCGENAANPNGVAASPGTTQPRWGFARCDGSPRVAATLGWMSESRWDSQSDRRAWWKMGAHGNSRRRGAEHLGLRLPYSKHCQRAFEQTPANPKGISSSSPGLLQPWVCGENAANPNGVAASPGTTQPRWGFARCDGSPRVAATLGWMSESRWDSQSDRRAWWKMVRASCCNPRRFARCSRLLR